MGETMLKFRIQNCEEIENNLVHFSLLGSNFLTELDRKICCHTRLLNSETSSRKNICLYLSGTFYCSKLSSSSSDLIEKVANHMLRNKTTPPPCFPFKFFCQAIDDTHLEGLPISAVDNKGFFYHTTSCKHIIKI